MSDCEADLIAVDIKELKLLGGFDHPNIVRFVRMFPGGVLDHLSIMLFYSSESVYQKTPEKPPS
jgi:hypothetical protein